MYGQFLNKAFYIAQDQIFLFVIIPEEDNSFPFNFKPLPCFMHNSPDPS